MEYVLKCVDRSRLTGVTYSIKIGAKSGKRISDLKVGGKPLDPKKSYLVSSWGGNLQNAGEKLQEKKIRPVYEVVSNYIKKRKMIEDKYGV